jgi:hypothetical protein
MFYVPLIKMQNNFEVSEIRAYREKNSINLDITFDLSPAVQ